MNKLITTDNGGFPFVLDDLRWMENGIREGFTAFASIWGNCILSGCTPDGIGTSAFTCTGGYAAIDGEMYAVDGTANPIDMTVLPYLYLEPYTVYDASGIKTFENGTGLHAAYAIRKAHLIAYNLPQTGKLFFPTLKTAENLISDMIVNYTHSYTKRQSWALGADDALVSGSNVIPLNNDTGNCFTLDIAAYDTPIARFSAPMPNGTWSAVKFSYTLGPKSVIIAGDITLTNGIDTNGKSYIFNNGEIAWFIWIGGKARLVNGWRLNESWQSLTLSNNVTGALKVLYLSNGDVAITGYATLDVSVYTGGAFATMPSAKYYPKFAQSFVGGQDADNNVKIFTINTDGTLTAGTNGSAGSIGYTINTRFSTL